jgi:hypothetical protein
MVEEFRTNPQQWVAEGNIAGDELANLTNLASWTRINSTLTSDGTITVDGKTFNVVKMVYTP